MYYIRKQGKTVGPISVVKLKEMASNKSISEDTLISEDKENWKPAGELSQLFPKKQEAIKPIVRQPTQDTATNIPLPAPLPLYARPAAVEQENVDAPAISTAPSNKYVSTLLQPQTLSARKNQETSNDNSPQGEKDVSVNLFVLLWNPFDTIPKAYQKYGDNKSLYAGLVLSSIAVGACYLAIENFIKIDGSVAAEQLLPPGKKGEDLFKVLFISFIPFISLSIGSYLVRTFFGDGKKGGVGGDALVSGAALLPISVSFLILSFIGKSYPNIQQEKAAVLVGALVLYALCNTIFILFSGCTRISGIKESIISIVITIMLIVSGIISYFAFDKFLTP